MRLTDVCRAAAPYGVALFALACGTEPPVPTSVAITPAGTLTFVSLNATQQLSAQVLDQRGTAMTGQVVTWSSASGTIATVDNSGLVTSKAIGTTTLTATSGLLTAQAPVAVSQVAATMAKTAGDGQTGVSSGPLSTPVTVKLTDAAGTAVFGAPVTFAVASGGGSLSNTIVISDAGGNAATTWTLGTSGPQQVTASVSASLTATFSATLVATAVSAFAGTGQTGLVGFGTNVRPAVRIVSSGNVPVTGVQVTFAVASGGGSLTTATVNTNASGIAQVGKWTLGATPGPNSLTATVTGGAAAGSPVTFTATGMQSGYNITIQSVGPPLSAPVQLAFDSAVAYWKRAIIGDLPDVPGFTFPAGQCGASSPAIGPVLVDDVIILARFDSIDGPGQILGSAGPCHVRPVGHLTDLGQMRFDTADVANLIGQGRLNDVIRHEMGHVLGYGTLWDPANNGGFGPQCLGNRSTAGSLLDTFFQCASSRAMFDSIGGGTYTGGQKVPVENCVGISGCGSGTYNSHWRESTFFNELMTGYLNSGGANPMSALSIASMEDLGYVVNYGAAETYVRVFTSGPAVRANGGTVINLGDDVYHGPIYTTGPTGALVPVGRR